MPRRAMRRTGKEKPIPFAQPPQPVTTKPYHRTQIFYRKLLKQRKEEMQPVLDIPEPPVLIRETQEPWFKTDPEVLKALDLVELFLRQRSLESGQNVLNSLILEQERKETSDFREWARKLAYFCYFKAILFDLLGEFDKSLYFFNEALCKLRKYAFITLILKFIWTFKKIILPIFQTNMYNN